MRVTISPFLRRVLLLDAAASGVMALLLIAGATLLAPLLALPQALLFWAGVLLVPWTIMLVMLSRKEALPRLALYDVVAVNALWVAASLGILVAGLVSPNLLGAAFIVVQAIAVAGFAVLQLAGLRRQVDGLAA
ncbi:MAG: hypothetical protein MEQ84_00265 [Mesorhizobium sp.]|nr:hypothetical protein [Mesorhizobium sp.]